MKEILYRIVEIINCLMPGPKEENARDARISGAVTKIALKPLIDPESPE